MDGLVTVAEAAAILRVTKRRASQFVTTGRIPVAVTVGQTFLLHRAEVEQFAAIDRPAGNLSGKPRKKPTKSRAKRIRR